MSDHSEPIPFNRPLLLGNELDNIRRAFDAMQTSGDGPFTARCAALLSRELGVAATLLTPSCTDALEMCAILLDLQPGDEVIVPAYSFVSTVNAFVLRGAKPVFADIRADTLNLDESRLEQLITPRTRAIVVVHYSGVGCEMQPILDLAGRHGISEIEDNAHGLFAEHRGRYLGSFGCLATLSFHETKNFSCGEGGALLINDPAHIERAEIVRDKGTDRQQLLRGRVEKYTWVDLGSSYVLSDILAAVLYAQLVERERVFKRRREVWERYDAAFRGSLEAYGVQLPVVPAYDRQSFHMYFLVLPSPEVRQAFIAHLLARSINAVFHYTPLHRSRMGRSLGGEAASCPVTERVSACLVRLPFYFGLEQAAQQRVIAEVRRFFTGSAR
jgi:dTDP-4-amino-4,6-dideoxygalactose transaminase